MMVTWPATNERDHPELKQMLVQTFGTLLVKGIMVLKQRSVTRLDEMNS